MACFDCMDIAAWSIFFPMSLLFSLGFVHGWNLWFATGFIDSVCVGFLWTLIPRVLDRPNLKVRDFFPAGMLVLFLLVLCETRGRWSGDSIFYTVCALIMFRTLFVLLRSVSATLKKISLGIGLWCLGLSVQLICDLTRVYYSFHSAGTPAPMEPLWLKWVSLRFLLLTLALGWGWMHRKGGRALLPGAILILLGQKLEWTVLVFGLGFMVELWLYQRSIKKV